MRQVAKQHAAVEISRNDIGLPGVVDPVAIAANDVRAAEDRDARPIGQGVCGRSIDADEVTGNDVPRAFELHADVASADDVAGCRRATADDVVVTAADDAPKSVAGADLAGWIGADEIALDQVATSEAQMNAVREEPIDYQAAHDA